MSSLTNKDYLLSLCRKYNIVPSKKYGQNFLINTEPIEKMIEAADLRSVDTVVEVGPGFGILTFELIKHAKKVLSFEIEKKLEQYWSENKKENLKLIWGNVLRALSSELPSGGYKVVANIPYQITSNVIRKFLEETNSPDLIVLMVQKEVAERICAEPGQMSVLSVSVQYYAKAEIVAFVPRSYFWPEPAVDSAIIKINKKIMTGDESELFFKVVKIGFANRRKLLIKNLESIVGKKNKEKLVKAFEGVGLTKDARAQELSVEQWKELIKKMQSPL